MARMGTLLLSVAAVLARLWPLAVLCIIFSILRGRSADALGLSVLLDLSLGAPWGEPRFFLATTMTLLCLCLRVLLLRYTRVFEVR